MIVTLICGALLTGSLVYCALAVVAVRSWKNDASSQSAHKPISVLKPLRGAEIGLADNLRSFFAQRHPQFEVLLAVATEQDGAYAIARQVIAEYPHIPSRLIIAGETQQPNGKVHSLSKLLPHAIHELLVMSDSDVRAPLDLLATLAAEVGNGVVFCLYRASGQSFWTELEAIGMNTEFAAGVFTARLLGNLDFALGPTLAMHRELLEDVGGFGMLQNYLAEDFVIGNRAAALGRRVTLSHAVIEHRLGAQDFASNIAHRLRWCRSTRRSRPFGYIGLIFTNPLPLAILFVLAAPRFWLALPLTMMIRIVTAWATAVWALDDPLTPRYCALVPLQDLLSFATYIGGFFGSSIHWRGRRLKVLRDGRFEVP